jgi:hypothetical protein
MLSSLSMPCCASRTFLKGIIGAGLQAISRWVSNARVLPNMLEHLALVRDASPHGDAPSRGQGIIPTAGARYAPQVGGW